MKLSDAKVEPAIAVSDMERAREFYEGKLGLSGGRGTGDGGRTYPCGEGTGIHIFQGQGAGESESTLAGFAVDDIEATVNELTGNGVTFEQYGDPINTNERGIAEFSDARSAWMKDPDGNVLGIVES